MSTEQAQDDDAGSGTANMYDFIAEKERGKINGAIHVLSHNKENIYSSEKWKDLFDEEIIYAEATGAHHWQIEEDNGTKQLAEGADPADLALVIFSDGTVLRGGLTPEMHQLSEDELEYMEDRVEQIRKNEEYSSNKRKEAGE